MPTPRENVTSFSRGGRHAVNRRLSSRELSANAQRRENDLAGAVSVVRSRDGQLQGTGESQPGGLETRYG